MIFLACLTALLGLAASSPLAAADTPVTGATRAGQVFQELQHPQKPEQKTFILTEKDLNDYFAAAIVSRETQGLKRATVDLLEDNRFSARILVNMDKVPFPEDQAGRMLRSFLRGDQLLEATGRLDMQPDTRCRFTLESSRINGMPLPSTFILQLANHYLRQERPDLDLSAPFDIGWKINGLSIRQDQLFLTRR